MCSPNCARCAALTAGHETRRNRCGSIRRACSTGSSCPAPAGPNHRSSAPVCHAVPLSPPSPFSLPPPSRCRPAAAARLTGSSAAGDEFGLVEAGTLTVATEGTYRPFSFHDETGDLVGFDVEIAQAVAEKLGLEVSFEETQWDAIFAGLEAGRFDVIANQVSINPEREEKYLFSEPYTVSPGVIVVTEDDDSISSFDDLAGKTTAQSLTSNWYELAQDSGATVEAVEGWAQAVRCCGTDASTPRSTTS